MPKYNIVPHLKEDRTYKQRELRTHCFFANADGKTKELK